MTERAAIAFPLERLFVDQHHDFVIDAVAPVLAWVPGRSAARRAPPYSFAVDRAAGEAPSTIDLTWSEAALAAHVPDLAGHVRRLRSGRTVQREHVTELAAYALTLVAISVFLPGRRVIGVNRGVAPDLLLDATPGAVRGVEAAGRTRGGRRALLVLRDGAHGHDGKAAQLRARLDLAEVHLSLWCSSPRVAMMERIKP